MKDTFTATIAASWRTAVVREPRFPPVVGAYLKALGQAGIPVMEETLGILDTGVHARNAAR